MAWLVPADGGFPQPVRWHSAPAVVPFFHSSRKEAIMSSISSVSSSIISSLYNSSSKSSKSAGSTTLDNLFSQLDSSNKGYLEKSDLATAFAQVMGTSSTTSSTTTDSATVDDVFAKLDGNGDGKVTKDELSTGVKNLADELDSQFNQMRMSGGTPPPPPPSGSDSGFTKDELTSQLSEIGSSDSTRSDLLNKVVNNFAAADTDSDGKVSFQEARTYDESTKTASTVASATDSTTSSDMAVMKRIMELMNAYSLGNSTDSSSSLLSTLSVSA
jgi:Ca2+-binding EF-hand superfamily protein